MDPPFHMSVNLSARQISRPEIVDEVRGILEETGLDPSTLVLEITESMVMQDMEFAIERLRALKELGVLLAIDDFGTGYSSLSYLHRFPVDILKIDRSFVERLGKSADDSELVATIVRLGQSLRMAMVAEGVENRDQLQVLQQLGCELAQGFLFSRPVPVDAVGDLLRPGRITVAAGDQPAQAKTEEAA